MKKMIFTLSVICLSAVAFTSCDKENSLLKNYECECNGATVGQVTMTTEVDAEAKCMNLGMANDPQLTDCYAIVK